MKFITILLVSSFPFISYSQKIVTEKIDPFTKSKSLMTNKVKLAVSEDKKEFIKVSAWKSMGQDTALYALWTDISIYDHATARKGDRAQFILDNDNILTLYCFDTEYSKQSNTNGMSYHNLQPIYIVSNEDLEALTIHSIKSVRFWFGKRDATYENIKDQDAIKNLFIFLKDAK